MRQLFSFYKENNSNLTKSFNLKGFELRALNSAPECYIVVFFTSRKESCEALKGFLDNTKLKYEFGREECSFASTSNKLCWRLMIEKNQKDEGFEIILV